MNFILFDDERFEQLFPLTHTRPVSELRCGILTLHEKWFHKTTLPVFHLTREFLQNKFPLETTQDNLLINGAYFPTKELYEAVITLKKNQCLVKDNTLLAARLNQEETLQFNISDVIASTEKIEFQDETKCISNLWDIFSMNDWAIREDFKMLTKGKTSEPISETNQVIGNDIFIEKGAKVECCILNSNTGPIYIGKDAEIMEGSIVRGPLAMGEHAVLKLGAKIYGATTIGPGCKVGGEVNNSVFFANSSKAHDGFIGNAVIGEWCNIGADTNNSNLKNNYEEVKLWNETKKSFVKTGLQFCGLIMGDHSKCGINTMLNTGTVIGVSCNVYGSGFPRNFIPSFSWGSANGFMEYQLNKAIDTATRVFARRNLVFDSTEKMLFESVFNRTQEQRNY